MEQVTGSLLQPRMIIRLDETKIMQEILILQYQVQIQIQISSERFIREKEIFQKRKKDPFKKEVDVQELKKKENGRSDYIKKKNWSLEKRRSDRGRKQNLLGHGN